MQLSIREATAQDLGAVLAAYADAGIETRGPMTVEQARRVFVRMGRYPDYRLYVAVEDGEVRGTYALLIMDNLANGGMPSGVVEDVAVVPRWQGHGIGRAMMEHALDRCRERGCYKLTLSSNSSRAGAHRFYESLGFVRHGYSFRVEFPVAPDDPGSRP